MRLVAAVLYRAALDARHEDKVFLCCHARWWLMTAESEAFMEYLDLDVEMVRGKLVRAWSDK